MSFWGRACTDGESTCACTYMKKPCITGVVTFDIHALNVNNVMQNSQWSVQGLSSLPGYHGGP